MIARVIVVSVDPLTNFQRKLLSRKLLQNKQQLLKHWEKQKPPKPLLQWLNLQ